MEELQFLLILCVLFEGDGGVPLDVIGEVSNLTLSVVLQGSILLVGWHKEDGGETRHCKFGRQVICCGINLQNGG
jgi:hypothetical protein